MAITKTESQYNDIIDSCRELFLKKNRDYGTSWRILRTISMVDQIYIKAKRIRNIQEIIRSGGALKVLEGTVSEYTGIVNYCVLGYINYALPNKRHWTEQELIKEFDGIIKEAMSLMSNKNHDYGEAWRELSDESFVDLILQKLERVKQIWNNGDKPINSEGIVANYLDILNYSVFALIIISERNGKW